MILVGDIGGTNTRLALFDSLKHSHIDIFPSAQYAGLDEIAAIFLKQTGASVEAACFGIAGPVRNGVSKVSNLPWVVDAREISVKLSIERVSLLNDLEANAHGIAVLEPSDLVTLNEGTADSSGNRALISAGTGLGEAGLLAEGNGYRPFASEGGHGAESIDISKQLDGWQKAGDQRLWKLIISPEFGDRIDLNRLIRELMTRMGSDLGTDVLEWTAAAHCNTEHPHVHIVLRGVDGHGQTANLDQDYVKIGIRRISENLCTQQLGYRTEKDAAIAERREVLQRRYTSLDRFIGSAAALSTTGQDDDRFFKFQASGSKGIRESLRRQRRVNYADLPDKTVARWFIGYRWLIGSPRSWRRLEGSCPFTHVNFNGITTLM
jgi:hypothetical protein